MNTTLEQVKANGEFLVKEYIKTRQPSIKEKIVQAYSPLVKYIVGRINFPSTAILAKEDNADRRWIVFG